ncbi:MAG: DUF6475 domain-containing protein [Myxococcales bacterium]
MTDADRTVFADTMTALQVAFGQRADPAVTASYWLFLGELSLPEFKVAAMKAGRELKFFPRPAELLALAGKGGPQALTIATAEAWEAVRGARRRHSYTVGVDFGPLVNAVVRNMGGWLAFCDKSDDALVWERKKFEELYAAFTAKDAASLNGEPLRGAFPGVERVAIGGVLPPLQLAASPSPVGDLVRELADAKAMPRTERTQGAADDFRAKVAADRDAAAAERKLEREARAADAVAGAAEKLRELQARLAVGGGM